jgi:hypothetical protein
VHFLIVLLVITDTMARQALAYLLVGGLASFADGAAVELTKANFESQVFGGKNAFVKFLAPW